MKQTVLYDEGYEYNISLDDGDFSIHFDYGTRYNQINMQFSHFHPNYEIYFLLSGQCQHFVEGQSFNLDTYDFVLLKPFRLHQTNYFEYQPCKRLIIQFNMDFFKRRLSEAFESLEALFNMEEPVFRFSQHQNSQLIHYFNQMYKASKQKTSTSDLLITGLFIQLLDQLSNQRNTNDYFHHKQDESLLSGNPIENKIYKITSYIHHHYAENLTLESLSSNFYISPHYLSRQFKLTTGFTLILYIQETRIKRAQELLLDTDMKIIDIIDQCGFGSISQFNRVFKNLAGCSPSKYRKNNRLS